MEDQVQFRHFFPSLADRQLCTNQLSMIGDLAPSDSCIDVIIDKLSDGTYRTVVNVKGVCGKFYSEGHEFSPLVSLQLAKKSMLKNFSEWKKLRFKKPSPSSSETIRI